MTIALVIPSMHFFEYYLYANIVASLQESLGNRNYRLHIITLDSSFSQW